MFALKLKELRQRKDFNQSTLARKLDTPQTTYSGWENGKEPKYEQLKKISNYFNVSIDYLLDNEKWVNNSNIVKIERILDEQQKKKLEEMIKLMFPKEYEKIKDTD